MRPDRSNYLEALGMPDFLYSSVGSEATENAKLLVLEVSSEDSFCESGASQDLLFKMLASISLSLNECDLISIDKSEMNRFIQEHSSDLMLIMDSSLSVTGESLFVTHHPKEIIKNPMLKRDSWEILKKVKSCLK